MNKTIGLITLFVLCMVLITGCGSSETENTSMTDFEWTPTPIPPTPTPFREGDIITVTSTSDSGPGTLRQALEDTQPYDTITFDPAVFPPDAPTTIFVSSEELPHIYTNNLTIDASNAGVILDGIQVSGGRVSGMQIVSANGVVVRGLRFTHFKTGITISGESKNNIIGGDRSVGEGPIGQGNIFVNNGTGIDISTSGATLNTVFGNLIGTDGSNTEDLKNYRDGIVIWEGAHDNTVGPDNIIANNGGAGVVVRHEDSQGNTITQNSIFDNYLKNISLMGGANAYLTTPLIVEFDLAAGTVVGVTCPDCTVEFYSVETNGGEIFEGQTTADRNGDFTFNKGSSFSVSFLTATSTDMEGNTSEFSRPTWGAAGAHLIQLDNNNPKLQILPRPSEELLDNRIGTQLTELPYGSSSDLWVYPIGLKRVRMTITGIEPEMVNWDMPELYIHPSHDAMVSRMLAAGIRITYTLMFWDKETYPNGESAPCARFKTKGEIERWLEYVRYTVDHFKGKIQYYEIWNEPDVRDYCPKWIELDDYIDLVARTIPVMREVDPEAKIVVGAISNTRFEQDYLFGLAESELMPMVDVISFHPMYSPSPEYDIYREYYYTYPAFIRKIQSTAEANGFNGEYQADEIGWATFGHNVADQPWVYSPIGADKYLARGIVLNLGLDVGISISDPDIAVIRNSCTIMSGALPVDLQIEVENSAPFTLRYAFSMPDNGYLIGLWTNGVATEYDPGVETTVTIPGVSARKIVGVDVLYGFEQELIFEMENGNLVIRNLLVKDYPIILRITGASSP